MVWLLLCLLAMVCVCVFAAFGERVSHAYGQLPRNALYPRAITCVLADELHEDWQDLQKNDSDSFQSAVD
jgi:hypothetical protein